VPGVDAFFIGPNDLTHSMGRAPVFESDDPEFVGALKHLREVGKKHGVASGIHVADAAAAARRLAEGFQMIAIASEAGLMLAKARETLALLAPGKAGTVAMNFEATVSPHRAPPAPLQPGWPMASPNTCARE